MTFSDLKLHPLIQKAVEEEGYTEPTPVQAEAIPHVLAGKDLLACAQTGTGKTAAFALPILDHILNKPAAPSARKRTRALILTPTRELAIQIGQSFTTYGKHAGFQMVVLYGGVNQTPQVKLLIHGVDIIVATPGRLLDLLDQGWADVKRVETLVLDEADNMLDMGFIDDIRKIISKTPQYRQTLLFSATMPDEIRRLSTQILTDPVSVAVARVSSVAETVDQSVIFVDRMRKPDALVRYLRTNTPERVLVFTKTKQGADQVSQYLNRAGIRAVAIHSDKMQSVRLSMITAFKSDTPPVLVATDIAARGLDIDNVTHVVNFDVPHVAENYVHRIGRTGRAGATGIAVSLCDREERRHWGAIERLTKQEIRVVDESAPRTPRPAAATHAPSPAPRAHAAVKSSAPVAAHAPAHAPVHAKPHAPTHAPVHAKSHTPAHAAPHTPPVVKSEATDATKRPHSRPAASHSSGATQGHSRSPSRHSSHSQQSASSRQPQRALHGIRRAHELDKPTRRA